MQRTENGIICRDCGKEFTHRNTKGGFIDQCDNCASESVERYIGVHGSINKSSNIEVCRKDLKNIRGYIEKGGVPSSSRSGKVLESPERPKTRMGEISHG